MVSRAAKKIINSTKPKSFRSANNSQIPLGQVGYDNPRDDIEKIKSLRELEVRHINKSQNNLAIGLSVDATIPILFGVSSDDAIAFRDAADLSGAYTGSAIQSVNHSVTGTRMLTIAGNPINIHGDVKMKTGDLDMGSGDITSTGNITTSSLTSTGVVFAGTGGKLETDNQHFKWDNINNRLGLKIGAGNPDCTFECDGESRTGNTNAGNYFKVDSDGGLFYAGNAGFPIASLYISDSSDTITLTQNIWKKVGAGRIWTIGQRNNCGASDQRVTIEQAGRYLIDWNVSGETDTANNQVMKFCIMIKDTSQAPGMAQENFITTGSIQNISGTCILDLAANDQIDIGIKNLSSGDDFIIAQANLRVMQVAG